MHINTTMRNGSGLCTNRRVVYFSLGLGVQLKMNYAWFVDKPTVSLYPSSYSLVKKKVILEILERINKDIK